MLKVLTSNQVEDYHRDGLLFPLPALSAAEVKYFRACHDDLDHRLGGRPTAVQKGDRHLDVKWICDLATHPVVLDAVEDIIGPDILIHSSTIFTKYAQDEKFVSWHQDSHYWGLSEPRLVSAWIALTDSTVDNGCLRVLPGTHTRNFEHLEEPQQTNILSRGHTVCDALDVDQAIDIVLRAGEMSFHHANLIHGSNPNTSSGPRIGVAVRYVATAVQQKKSHIPVILARGRDDYHHYELQERPSV
ncbi:MAG TPA: phytanoyl-CoA dioxygenase family protein [Pyrinomonadaceae bacterium]|nr:phytanoyl-CoA dioxygenase family protein [Pyrinomonadaceae bacterium]